MEKEVLPLSRTFGAYSLPSEVMVKIMGFVGDWASSDPKSFKKTMWTVFETPPFDVHLKDAKDLLRRWKQLDQVWSGCLPPMQHEVPLETMTSLHLSTFNTSSLHDFQEGLKLLKALEHLDISCRFDYNRITSGQAFSATVPLPTLKSLYVSNIAQKDDLKLLNQLPQGWNSTLPLKRTIRMLYMPNLTSIGVKLYTSEKLPCELQVQNEILSLSDCTFPHVKAFAFDQLVPECSTAWSQLDLSKAFSSLPSLTHLKLASCHNIDYHENADSFPTGLRSLKLEYGKEFGVEECLRYMHGLQRMFRKSGRCLEEVKVVTSYKKVFDTIQKEYLGARWVTDTSILDEEI